MKKPRVERSLAMKKVMMMSCQLFIISESAPS